MRPIEILALIIAALATVKIVIILIKPTAWRRVVHNTYGKPALTVPIALILAAVFLNILLKEMTIIHIFAAMSFIMMMMMAGAASFGKEIATLSDQLLQDRDVLKKSWLTMAVWLCLCVWVMIEIFNN